jgi:hypothetical protein
MLHGIHAEKASAHKEIGVITTLNDLFMNKLTVSKCKPTTKVTWSVQASPSHCIWWNSPRAFCPYTHFGCPKIMALQETTSGSVTPSCCICSNSSNAIADVPWSWQSKSVHHIWASCWTFYKYLPCSHTWHACQWCCYYPHRHHSAWSEYQYACPLPVFTHALSTWPYKWTCYESCHLLASVEKALLSTQACQSSYNLQALYSMTKLSDVALYLML